MKIGFFITARLKSTRLKRKILLDLNGKSVLDRVIERAKQVKGIDGVVLCTSTNPQDSELYKNALSNQIEFYAGSEEDVLKRLLDAAKYYSYDAFLSITADNPLHSILIAENIITIYKTQQPDFIFTGGLPVGIAPYFLNTKALRVVMMMKKESETEIWGPFVNHSDFFRIGKLQVNNSHFKANKRLTCDYPEDYKLFKAIYTNFHPNHIPSINEVFNFLKENPSLWEINNMHEQQYVSLDKLDLISIDFNKNREAGIRYAAEINKPLKPGEIIIKLDI